MERRLLQEFLRRHVFNDFRLKVLALVLAVLLWFSRTYLGETKMTYLVPVTFENIGKQLMVRDTTMRDLTVTVNGSLSDLKNLRPRDMRIDVDLSRAKEGRQIFTIRKGDIVLPNGVKIEELKPDYVVVEIEKVLEKQLPTVVKLSGKWESIYRITSWYPRSVIVEASEDALSGKKSIETIPIDGDFRQQQEVLDVPLNIRSLTAKKVKPETVRVVLKRVVR
jgi:diadenylate cyclase